MAKFTVLKEFKDTHTKEVYKVGAEIELTAKRAKEVEKNLQKHGGSFLEKVSEESKQEE